MMLCEFMLNLILEEWKFKMGINENKTIETA